MRHSPDSGAPRSVPMETLLERGPEAGRRRCARTDRNRTGHDLLRPGPYGKRRLAELLKPCAASTASAGSGSTTPTPAFPDEDRVMAREPKICKYLDIPLPAYLRRSARGHAPTPYQGPGLRTDRQTEAGHSRPRAAHDPAGRISGRNKADFEELQEFVRTVRFERLGVFPYSEEEGNLFGPESAGRCSGRGQTKSCRTSNGASE